MNGIGADCTLIITMAGVGRRFKEAGFEGPKYRLQVKGRSLFAWSQTSLLRWVDAGARFVFIALAGEEAGEFIAEQCRALGIIRFEVLEIDQPTDGQATTALMASEYMETCSNRWRSITSTPLLSRIGCLLFPSGATVGFPASQGKAPNGALPGLMPGTGFWCCRKRTPFPLTLLWASIGFLHMPCFKKHTRPTICPAAVRNPANDTWPHFTTSSSPGVIPVMLSGFRHPLWSAWGRRVMSKHSSRTRNEGPRQHSGP